MNGLMGKFRVGTRIYVGFGFVLAMLCVVAVLGYQAVQKGTAGLNEYATVSNNALSVETIDRQVVGLRRNTYVYYDSGSATSLKRAHDLIGLLQAGLDATIQQTRNAERQAKLRSMRALIDEYATGVDAVVEKRAKREKLVRERMDVSGAAARKNLTAIIASAMKDGDNEAAALAGQTQESLMLARLGAIRYLAGPSEALKTETEKRVGSFIEKAKALAQRLDNPERKRLAIEAEKLARDYVSAFSAMAQTALEVDELVFKTLTEKGLELSKLAAETVALQQANLKQTKTDTDELFATLATVAITVSSIAIVLGLLFAFLVSRGITGPVGAMTGAMMTGWRTGISRPTSRPPRTATKSAKWPRRSRCSRTTPSGSSAWRPNRPSRRSAPRRNAAPPCISLPTASKRASAGSSTPSPRPWPNFRRPPNRWPRRRTRPVPRRRRWPRHPNRRRPMSRPWPRRPRSFPLRSPRSAARSPSRRRSRAARSVRPTRPTPRSRGWPRRPARSARWST